MKDYVKVAEGSECSQMAKRGVSGDK